MAEKLIIPLLSLMFLLLPWHYFDPGLQQPVDVIICLLAGIFFMLKKPDLHYFLKSHIFKSFILLSFYILLALFISLALYKRELTILFIEQNIYFIVLVISFLSMIIYLNDEYGYNYLYKLMIYFLLFSLLLPCLNLFFVPSLFKRTGLTFNSANQLGFFSLANMSIFIYFSLLAKEKKIPLNKILSFFIINANLFLLFLSSSRGASVEIFLYILSYFIIFDFQLKTKKKYLFSILFSLTLLFSLVYALFHYMDHARLHPMTLSLSYIMHDIYMREIDGIGFNFTHIKSFLFGNSNHITPWRHTNLEFHNNFIYLFNQVGIIGLFLYVYLNLNIFKQLYTKGYLYIVPFLCYLFYSLFNYSYRDRANWLLLAIIIFITMLDRNKQQGLFTNERSNT